MRSTVVALSALFALSSVFVSADTDVDHGADKDSGQYVVCAQEDSPGPCYWDATQQGNGQGHSFIVDSEQTIHYIS